MAHLRQSIADILSTPIGSRIHRRDYGSRLFELTDRPLNADFVADLYAATVDALDRWEPRFRLQRVRAEIPAPGRILLTVEGEVRDTGEAVTFEGITVQ